MFKRYKLKDYDFKLLLMIIALGIIGVLTIGSAEPSLQNKQMFGLIAGIGIMIFVSLINYSFILQFNWIMYIFNLILLILVIISGDTGGGAQRWFSLGGIRFQPSETAKILLILFFAQFIMKREEHLNTFKILGESVLLILVPWFMIFKQPDLSTSIVIVVIFCIILYAGGISFKIIISLLVVAVPMVAIVVSLALQPDNDILDQYQKNRVLAFINPEEYSTAEAYQQLNSETAIASGMLDGKGYKNNEITSVKNGNFISEAQTDFIFAVIGEEFGFKGSVIVILLLTFISLECVSIARRAKDTAGKIIASGMAGLVMFQGFFNIGVATFLLPNTGLPLPFVSYGLTSLLSLCIGMGVVINVRLQAKRMSTNNLL